VPLGDRLCGGVQPKRAARVTQPAPLPDRVRRSRGRERRRCRPPLQPRRICRKNPGHRRLLQHDLADQDRPRASVRPAPGQVTRMGHVPVQDRRSSPVHHDSPIVAQPRPPGPAANNAACAAGEPSITFSNKLAYSPYGPQPVRGAGGVRAAASGGQPRSTALPGPSVCSCGGSADGREHPPLHRGRGARSGPTRRPVAAATWSSRWSHPGTGTSTVDGPCSGWTRSPPGTGRAG
jgi:hypothetical protein